MIERIVFLPSAPILDPEVATGAAYELDALRAVIDRVLSAAISETEAIQIVGSDQGSQLGQLLLNRLDSGSVAIRAGLDTEPNERTSLIVMGDGSAKRTEKAPGYIDDRATAFDDQVQQIFEQGNLAELAELDQELGKELWVAGIEPWNSVGKWAASTGANWQPQDFHFEDPYGVAYFVASFKIAS